VEGEAGSSYVTGTWSNQDHLTVESAEPASEFTVYAVLWPDRISSAPAALQAVLNDGALHIARPDGKADVITLTDTSLKLE
jgi:hypothetical protein